MIKRRLKGEPIAYILGYKDFCELRFKVNRNVLIPRPETEGLVERVLSVIPEFAIGKYPESRKIDSRLRGNDKIQILDLGTGSGCVIISLAKVLKAKGLTLRYEFYASDISKKALKVARANAKAHKVEIKFTHTDILENVRMKFDIIVANLPYGWKEWKNNTTAETIGLKFEPKEALFTSENGLFQIRRLLEQISKLPQAPRLVYLEFDPRQKLLLSKLIKKYLPKADIGYYRDCNNLWRFGEIIPKSVF